MNFSFKHITLFLLIACFLQGSSYQTVTSIITGNLSHTKKKQTFVQGDKLVFKLPQLSEYEACKIAGAILANFDAYTEHDPSSFVIDTQTIEDLSLCGSDGVLSTFPTHSTCGKLVMGRMLITPTTNQELLMARQSFIAHLAENKGLRDALHFELESFAACEPLLLSLWNKQDILYSRDVAENFYQGSLDKPHTAVPLELQRRFQDAMTWGSPLINFALSYALTFVTDRFGVYVKSVLSPGAEKESAQERQAGRVGLSLILSILFEAISWRRNWSKQKNRINIVEHLRARLAPLVELKTVFHATSRLLFSGAKRSLGSLHQLFPLCADITSFFGATQDTHASFLSLLESPSFKENSYYFSNVGPVLAALPTFKQLRPAFGAFFEHIGTLDAYVALATAVAEKASHNNAYCAAHYARKPQPSLELSGVWHPCLGDKGVPNNTCVGDKEPQNHILTGPNAAGKSTYLKSVIIAAIMAQTFGIVPAQKALLTPFAHIATYLNIIDDIGNEQSLFKAEVMRAQELLTTIAQLSPGQFSLTALDEMFCGTAPLVGQATAYALSETLGSALSQTLTTTPQSCTLIATHFKLLTRLAHDHPQHFVNKKFSALKQDDGSYHYSYKVSSGISEQTIALDLLTQQDFNPTLLSYAYEHLARLTP